MKTNKKVQKNSVQKSEKENAVKVTALAIIPKPMTLLTPQDVPTATEEAPQQATFKTPLATATAETDLDITTVHPSRDNHRKTFNDASLQELAESIREVGILQAIAVRPRTEGGYEIIAGHRRLHASQLLGLETMPVLVRQMDDDTAIITMVDSNLQRETMLPSERARAYKMKMDAMARRAGRPSKENSGQLDRNFLGKETREIIAEQTGESARQVQRYVNLTNLIPELMEMVDNKKIAFNPAVE